VTTVSILIPAHRPEFLTEAITSALTQTFEDIEILVGDNTSDGALEGIVNQFGSPKLKYFHHGFDNGGANARALWEKASGRYVKWLFYDDLLMPASVGLLVDALQKFPQATMAFHGRVMIDEKSTIVHTPRSLLANGQTAVIDRSYIVRNMVPQLDNFIGEPSFVMLDRSRIDIAELSKFNDHVPDFLGDVCAYLAAARLGPIAVVGGYHGAFRRHGAQESASGSPIFAMGLIEWEVFLRGEAAEGNLTIREILTAKQRLEEVYTRFSVHFPELQRFLAGLNELTDELPGRLPVSEAFKANIAHAREAMKARAAAAKRNAA
jgi:glycosyltransferase involved in cell wall biosynthesis